MLQSACSSTLLRKCGRLILVKASSHVTRGSKAVVSFEVSVGWRQVSRVNNASLPHSQWPA